MFRTDNAEFFVCGGDERAASEGVGPSQESAGVLVDGEDGLVREQAVIDAGNFQVMMEVIGHFVEFEAVEMGSSDDS